MHTVSWFLSLVVVAQVPAPNAPEKAPAAAPASRPVPIQVVGEGRAWPAQITVYAYQVQGDRLIRGRVVAQGRTGARGEPYSVELAPSLQAVFVQAREIGGSESVLGSALFSYDDYDGVWKEGRGVSGARIEPGIGPIERPKLPQTTVFVRVPRRVPVEIFALNSGADRLVGFAEVAIYTMTGQCVRRGSTRIYGAGFNAEQNQLLDPAYKQLRVVARSTYDTSAPAGSLLLVFDHNNWRPQIAFPIFREQNAQTHAGSWQGVVEMNPQAGELPPVVESVDRWSPSRVQVVVLERPVPAGGLYPGFWGQGNLGTPPTSLRMPPPPPSPVPTALSPNVVSQAEYEAQIVAAGQPTIPGLVWADYGNRWARGGNGTYYQVALPPATGQAR